MELLLFPLTALNLGMADRDNMQGFEVAKPGAAPLTELPGSVVIPLA